MARRPLVLRKQFKTSRHRCPLDISIFEKNHATLPRQIPVQRVVDQPDDSATNHPDDSANNQPDDSANNQPDDSANNQPGGDGNKNGTTVAMEGPVLGHNFGLGQGLKRRRRVAIECPGLFKLPCPRPDYVPKYDKSKPWKATEGTVVVIGPLPGNLNRPSPFANFNRPSPFATFNRPSPLATSNRPSPLATFNRPLPLATFNRPSPLATSNRTVSQTMTATIGHSMASSDETGTSDQQSASTDTYQPCTHQLSTYQRCTHQPSTYQPHTYQPSTYQPDTYQPDTYQPYGYPFTSTCREGLSAPDTESPCSKVPIRVTRPAPPHVYHTSVMETPLSHSESPLVPSIGQSNPVGQIHSTVPAVTSLGQVPGHLPPFPAKRNPPMATRVAPPVETRVAPPVGTSGITSRATHPGKTQKSKVSKELEVADLELECPTSKIRPSLQNLKTQNFKIQNLKPQNFDPQVASGQNLAPVPEVPEVATPPFMIHFPPLHLRED